MTTGDNPGWMLAFLMFGMLYAVVVLLGNIYVYTERQKHPWTRLSDKETYLALKWTYLWPFLLMYHIPHFILTEFIPWVWGGFCKFFSNYWVAFRVLCTGK